MVCMALHAAYHADQERERHSHGNSFQLSLLQSDLLLEKPIAEYSPPAVTVIVDSNLLVLLDIASGLEDYALESILPRQRAYM